MDMEKIKQKLSGIAMVILGVLTVLPENDVTAAVLLVPLGIFLLVTKEQVMEF